MNAYELTGCKDEEIYEIEGYTDIDALPNTQEYKIDQFPLDNGQAELETVLHLWERTFTKEELGDFIHLIHAIEYLEDYGRPPELICEFIYHECKDLSLEDIRQKIINAEEKYTFIDLRRVIGTDDEEEALVIALLNTHQEIPQPFIDIFEDYGANLLNLAEIYKQFDYAESWTIGSDFAWRELD